MAFLAAVHSTDVTHTYNLVLLLTPALPTSDEGLGGGASRTEKRLRRPGASQVRVSNCSSRRTVQEPVCLPWDVHQRTKKLAKRKTEKRTRAG